MVSTDLSNQCRDLYRYEWQGFIFRSKAEIKIAIELDKYDGLLFLPCCLARINTSNKNNIEPDFVICYKGIWAILEVDGNKWHDGKKDEIRDSKLEYCGVRVIRFDSEDCNARPEAVVREFIEAICGVLEENPGIPIVVGELEKTKHRGRPRKNESAKKESKAISNKIGDYGFYNNQIVKLINDQTISKYGNKSKNYYAVRDLKSDLIKIHKRDFKQATIDNIIEYLQSFDLQPLDIKIKILNEIKIFIPEKFSLLPDEYKTILANAPTGFRLNGSICATEKLNELLFANTTEHTPSIIIKKETGVVSQVIIENSYGLRPDGKLVKIIAETKMGVSPYIVDGYIVENMKRLQSKIERNRLKPATIPVLLDWIETKLALLPKERDSFLNDIRVCLPEMYKQIIASI